jgi:hypothetical protein
MLKQNVSLDRLEDFEQRRTVNTPLSLEACRSEGIDPSELLFKPRSAFDDLDLPDYVKDLEYEFYEKRRQETLSMVRKKRELLAKEEHTRSQSGSRTMASPRFEGDLERAKEKHLKFINKIMASETVASEKMTELQREKARREEMEQRKREEEILAERKRTEDKHRAEIEAALHEKDQERNSRRQALKAFKQTLQEKQEQEEKEKERKRQAEAERQARERERQAKIEQVLSAAQKALQEKEIRLLEKREKDKLRQQRLREQQDQLRARLSAQGQAAEKKRYQVLENLQAQLEDRRQEYYRRRQEERMKTERFLAEQRRSLESLRMSSSQRNDRIFKTRETSEKMLEENRKQILKKSSESDLKVAEQKQKLEQEMEQRRYRDMLKDLKKELNLQRFRRKQDYIAQQAERRLQEQYRRIDQFGRMKSQVLNRRLQLSTENEIKKFSMKESLYQMTVSKKWDFKLLKKIAEEGGSTSKSRPKTQNYTTTN